MKRLDRALLSLAETGRPRGADALLRSIEAELSDDVVVGFPNRERQAPSRRSRRLRWILAAAIATLLLLGGPALLLTMDDEPIEVDVVTTVPQTMTTLAEDPTPSTIGIPTTTTSPPITTTTLPPRPLALDIMWERIESPVLENAWLSAIEPWRDGYLAVGGSIPGHDAAVWLSEDGFTWEKIASDAFGSDQEWLGGDGDQFMNGVAARDDVIVAVGSDEVAAEHDQIGAIWYSSDGRTWNRVPHDPTVFGADATYLDSIVAWNGQFVAAGVFEDTTGVWVSTDGRTWELVDDPDLRAFAGSDLETKPVRIVGGRLYLVMATVDSDGSLLLTSDDGTSWDVVAVGPGDKGIVDLAGTPNGDVIGLGGGGAGWWARAWRLSEDGQWEVLFGGWSEHQSDIVIAVDSTNTRTLVSWAGSDIMWGSLDGMHWYRVGEFETHSMEILDVPSSRRVWGTLIDILDEGDRIFAVGSGNAWSSTEDIGGRCYIDPGDGSRGSCRSDAAIWIGTPAG